LRQPTIGDQSGASRHRLSIALRPPVFGYSKRRRAITRSPVLSGNFHADGRRWLDLFIDEQINAMKNDPLDDSSVGVALRLRLKLEKSLDRLLADIMEAHFRWAIEAKLVN
jgi:hypothetical protein